MNAQQIEWLKSLDADLPDGTLASIYLRKDINTIPFEKASMFLISALYAEKKQLTAENKKYIKELKKHNLYTNELIMGEGE